MVNEIISLKVRLSAGDTSVADDLFDLENQFKALTLRDLEGSKICSRVLWFEEGQKPTWYFFKLERERVDRNTVTSILNSDDVEVFSREEIEQVHVDFYTNLSLDCITCFLSSTQSDSCEGVPIFERTC